MSYASKYRLVVIGNTNNVPVSISGFRRIGAAPEVKWAISVQDCAETIKPWLKECLEQHSSCKTASATHTPKPLPKRVLDVADQKVVLTEPGSKKGLYVALSHSWGKAEVLTTTIQTLADRKQKILTKALPRSFHEAVMITRALGLRYLWIDSLCIIQDDPKDWAEQVATMGEVYGNCFLNIAATRSSRPLDGFISPHYVFSDTLAWSQEGQPLPGNDAASKPVSKNRIMAFESYPVSIQEESNPYHGKLRVRLALNSPHDSVLTTCWNPAFKAEAPLFSRAWAYQERCLAPRTVHFHANELVWECASKSHCECQALDEMCIPEGYNAAKSFILTRQPRSISPMSPGILGKGKLDIGAFWRVIVEDYTPLHLTYESDRLPAIGGLASKIHGFFHLSGNDYLAGLWRHTLARDLLWEVSGSSTVPRRGQLGDKTPPSWSWASLTWGDDKPGIKWEYESKPKALMHGVFTTYKQDKRFSIVKATSSPTSSWPYGHVSGGSITVTGAMCAIAVSDNTAPIPQIWRDQIPVKSKDILNSLHLRYDDPCDEDEVTHPDNPVRGLIFCIFVGTFYSHFELDREGEHPNRKGLILKPSKTVPGAAERIGVWDQYIEEWTVGKAVFSMEATTVTVTIV